jgi:hypothetical protein
MSSIAKVQKKRPMPLLPSGGCPRFYIKPDAAQAVKGESGSRQKPYESSIDINIVSIRDILSRRHTTDAPLPE